MQPQCKCISSSRSIRKRSSRRQVIRVTGVKTFYLPWPNPSLEEAHLRMADDALSLSRSLSLFLFLSLSLFLSLLLSVSLRLRGSISFSVIQRYGASPSVSVCVCLAGATRVAATSNAGTDRRRRDA